MDYRASCGEKINKERFVMRDIWQTDDLEGISEPKPLNSFAITRLLNRAWQAQKIRPQLQKGEKGMNLRQPTDFENTLRHKWNRHVYLV